MSSIYDIFNIGKHGMMAQQTAMQVTSHNLANVNTAGYSRQEVVFTEGMPLNSSPGQLGTGVDATAIKRKYDSFIEGQLTGNREALGNLDVQRGAMSKIENLFYDSNGTGINTLLSQFFNSLQDLSANPAGTAERGSILSSAGVLADAMNSAYSSLEQLQKDLNSQVKQTVADINDLSEQIAAINSQIQRAENAGQNANDFRDMRGRLLNELAELIDIQYFEDQSGQMTVIGGGMATLVEKGNSWELDTKSDPDNHGYYDIVFSPDNSNILDLTDNISNGRIKGFLTIRDTETHDAMDELDRLAASIANEINQVHRGGYGLDGSTGINLFSPSFETGDVLSQDVGSIRAQSTNTGTGSLAVTIGDPSELTYNNYEISFSGGNYTITNTGTNTSASAAYVNPATFTFEGLSVTISGSFAEGDEYFISAHKNTDALTLDGSASFSSYYGSVVGRIGNKAQYINNSHAAQEFSSEQLRKMRESVSGVSIDEEMTNLMKYQLAYEASARLVTIGDELLDTLLRMIQ